MSETTFIGLRVKPYATRTNTRTPDILRPNSPLGTLISAYAYGTMGSVSTLRSSLVVSARATGDCRGCASAAKASAAGSRSGAKGTRAQKLNCLCQPLSPTPSLRYPHSAGSGVSFFLPGDRARTVVRGTMRTRLCVFGQTPAHPVTTLQVPAWPAPYQAPRQP